MSNNTPENLSAAQSAMIAQSELPRALFGGTRAMREKGERYLPRQPHESKAEYDERLKATFLRNVFERSVQSMVGKIMSKDIDAQDVNPRIQPMLDDIDLLGNKLSVFAASVLQDALIDGMAYILVERPSMAAVSAADELSGINRPYWVHLSIRDVLGVRYTIKDGKPIISQLRFRQVLEVEDGPYGEKEIEQVRVINRDSWETWEKGENGYQLVDSGVYTLGEVAIVPVYTKRSGHFKASPPLEGLADLNLEHWQIRSDQRRALSRCSWPVLIISGFGGKPDEIVWGPDQMIALENPEAKASWIESGGQHLAAGRDELNDLIDQMRIFSLQFEATNGRQETAQGRSIDASENMAPLQRWANNLQDALNSALYFTGRWMNLDAPGSVKIDKNFLKTSITVDELRVLLQARQAGEISREAFLSVLKQRGLLDENFDIEADAQLLADDPQLAAFGAQ